MNDWKQKFQENVTRVTFNLVLTKAMLEFLCAAAGNVSWDRTRYRTLTYPDNWIATEHALTKRGLVVRKTLKEATEEKETTNAMPLPWKLTPAGIAVVELLKVGGLFIEAQEALDKFAARKGHK